jgi:endo-1,4-beta-xylanase
MKTKHFKASILCLISMGILLAAVPSRAQIAAGANKYLGNITTRGQVRTDYLTYWNQITPENESKWSSVEGTRGRFNWGGVDAVKNFAEKNKIPWKFHTLVWGGQYPSWMDGLSQADQLMEVTKWFDSAAARYPNVNMIDVCNESNPGHNPPKNWKNCLGGDGATGFDWIIKSFQMARQRWPHALLIYNDYNTIEYSGDNTWCVNLITAMKKANAPIDGIGCQAHGVGGLSVATVKGYMDKLAATGLPLFITEFDVADGNDDSQKQKIQNMLTLFWTHPKVVGITYWGYLVGATWINGTGLLNTTGTERPALTWMKDYVKSNPNPPNDFPTLLTKGTGVFYKGPSVAPVVVRNTIGPKLVYNPKLGVIVVTKNNAGIFTLTGKRLKENLIGKLK